MICAVGWSFVLFGVEVLSSLLASDGSSAIGGGDGVTDISIIFEKFGFMHGVFSAYGFKLAEASICVFIRSTGKLAGSV